MCLKMKDMFTTQLRMQKISHLLMELAKGRKLSVAIPIIPTTADNGLLNLLATSS